MILLDAVIYLLELKEINEGSRRSFNQQKVLIECIVAELQRTDAQQYHRYLNRDEKIDFNIEIKLEDLCYPWHDAARLKGQILADPTTKSRDKFVNIAESLFSHHVLAPFQCDLGAIFRQVISKVLLNYPVCITRNAPESPSSRAATPQPVLHAPCGFQASLFDDIAESELDSQSWNILDEWMSYSSDTESSSLSTSPVVMSPAAPASVPVWERPAHPLPLPEVGYSNNSSKVPLVHVNRHFLSEFRSIDHTSVEMLTVNNNSLVEICRPTPARTKRAPLTVDTDTATHDEAVGTTGPFPDPQASSVYSRRVSFKPVVAALTPLPGAPASQRMLKHCSEVSVLSARTDTSCSMQLAPAADPQKQEQERPAGRACAVVSAANSPSFLDPSTAGSSPDCVSAGYWECSTGNVDGDSLDFDIDLEGLAECCGSGLGSSFNSDGEDSGDDLGVLFLPIQSAQQTRKRPAHVLDDHLDDLRGPVLSKPRYYQ